MGCASEGERRSLGLRMDVDLGIEKNILCYVVVISVNGPVVSLQGFLMAFVNELFRLAVIGGPDNEENAYGLVVNLYRDETMNFLIGALLLNPEIRLSEGAKVTAMSRLASIVLGDFAIGSILDGWGNFILNSGRVDVRCPWLVESPAPGIIYRQSVFEPLQTGVISVDSIIPLGRGQRELVVGDRQTGKTSIGLDTILNQRYEKVLCVYLPLAQKASSVLEVFLALVRRDAVFYLSMLVASAASSAVCQFLSAYAGAATCEFFMYVGGVAGYLMLDDLSRHAMAYREFIYYC